jgi:hypothetical protein
MIIRLLKIRICKIYKIYKSKMNSNNSVEIELKFKMAPQNTDTLATIIKRKMECKKYFYNAVAEMTEKKGKAFALFCLDHLQEYNFI